MILILLQHENNKNKLLKYQRFSLSLSVSVCMDHIDINDDDVKEGNFIQ